MRISAGSIRQAKNGAYIHLLEASDTIEAAKSSDYISEITSSAPIVLSQKRDKSIDIDRFHSVYTSLLSDHLNLTKEHAADLTGPKRSLSPETVAANLYASTPSEMRAREICDELQRRYDLCGVPGFYAQLVAMESGCSEGCFSVEENMNKRWHLKVRYHGILIPIRDPRGRIAGCQIRCNGADAKPKYVWLSSRGLPEGASSGAPVHYAKPDLAKGTRRAIITEGALKADICSEHLSCCVIGLPGVSSFPSNFGLTLKADMPFLYEVAIAFDTDWRDKPEVKNALERLHSLLIAVGLKVPVWEWDIKEGKGFDDYLIKQKRGRHDSRS